MYVANVPEAPRAVRKRRFLSALATVGKSGSPLKIATKLLFFMAIGTVILTPNREGIANALYGPHEQFISRNLINRMLNSCVSDWSKDMSIMTSRGCTAGTLPK